MLLFTARRLCRQGVRWEEEEEEGGMAEQDVVHVTCTTSRGTWANTQ